MIGYKGLRNDYDFKILQKNPAIPTLIYQSSNLKAVLNACIINYAENRFTNLNSRKGVQYEKTMGGVNRFHPCVLPADSLQRRQYANRLLGGTIL
jgi:hypothetical protein